MAHPYKGMYCRMLLKIDCCGNVYYKEIDIFSRKDGVNGPATFSTLKPNTGFDSTSVKSSGASLDFCYCGDNQILGRGQEKISDRCSCVITTVESVDDAFISKTENRITAIITSSEIVCATVPRAPVSEYFESEAHPDLRME